MRKTMYALLGMVCIFTSCSNEENLNDQPVSIEGERVVTFSLGVPGREPVTYAQVHESDEYQVTQLDIFQFDATQGLVKVYHNVTTTAAASGENVARKNVAQIKLPVGTTGVQNFLFVANNNPEKMQEALSSIGAGIGSGTTVEGFKEQLTKALATTNAKIAPAFLMTGEKSVTVPNATPIDLTGDSDIVYLTRVVARIDVGIRLATSEEELTISKIELKNAPRYTYLFPQAHQSPNNSGKADYEEISAASSPTLASHFDNVSTTAYTSRYKKLFYLYERKLSQFTSQGTPTLYITGEYKPTAASEVVKVRYEVPFTIDVIRNHLYTVVLGIKPDGDKYVTTSEIKTLKWEDEIEIPTDAVQLYTFAPSNTDFTYEPSNRTMTLNSGSAKTYTDAFTVTSLYAGDDNEMVLEKSGPISSPNNYWISATTTSGKISITVEANGEGKQREGVIWFRSKKDTGKNQLYGIKLVQPKP